MNYLPPKLFSLSEDVALLTIVCVGVTIETIVDCGISGKGCFEKNQPTVIAGNFREKSIKVMLLSVSPDADYDRRSLELSIIICQILT